MKTQPSPATNGKHIEHMIVALCYLEEHDLATATDKMRAGIMNLLTAGFGVDQEKEMPYHETLTVFWMRAVYAYSLMHKEKTLVEKANEMIESFDKDHPLNFYTRDRLFSAEARAAFIEPDIKPMQDLALATNKLLLDAAY